MTNEQQALADMPIWLVILLAVVGGVWPCAPAPA